ncbi:roadblock/LC7 domain-containing protein [Streptomyces mirabilis]|uniref:roadblock/LC7 domain-containing protein n=1 Tax=Streptomyces mirabilis TaxID=68239 RepID=UPI000C71014E|nr:roadblock/LC7 domain-containing protein [Streptomyces mirabilis]MCT9107580.1 roadblock/LC7 domain-containing protein [Streptomyces mirabilis]
MSEKTTTSQTAASDLTWLLDGFKDRVSGVDTVLVVSADGIHSHTCTGLAKDDAEHLAAITAGTYMLMSRVDVHYGGPGAVRQVVAQLGSRMFFVTDAAENSLLAVIAHPGSDAGQVGHEMLLLANQVRTHLASKSRAAGTAG